MFSGQETGLIFPNVRLGAPQLSSDGMVWNTAGANAGTSLFFFLLTELGDRFCRLVLKGTVNEKERKEWIETTHTLVLLVMSRNAFRKFQLRITKLVASTQPFAENWGPYVSCGIIPAGIWVFINIFYSVWSHFYGANENKPDSFSEPKQNRILSMILAVQDRFSRDCVPMKSDVASIFHKLGRKLNGIQRTQGRNGLMQITRDMSISTTISQRSIPTDRSSLATTVSFFLCFILVLASLWSQWGRVLNAYVAGEDRSIGMLSFDIFNMLMLMSLLKTSQRMHTTNIWRWAGGLLIV